MVKFVVFLICMLCLCVYNSYCYKILVVFPYTGKSVVMLGDAVVRILLEAGHEMTYITPYPIAKYHENLHQVIVRNDTFSDIFNIRKIFNNKEEIDTNLLSNMFIEVSRKTLENENVQQLMNDPYQKFDLVVVQWLFSELYSAFSTVFNCPYIWVGTTEPHAFLLSLINEAPNPAYATDILSLHIPPLTFYQHLQELKTQLWTYITKTYLDDQFYIYEKIIGPIVAKRGNKLFPYDQVRYNASLIFANSHYSIGQALSLPQNLKLIGGYHIDPDNIKPLQGDLSAIMNNSANGVIYFSMGSNLKSKDIPYQIKRDVLNMFGGLRQSVVWKFEEELEDVPSNVYIIKWAPQLSILAHPNCRLFITHGGVSSIIETIHFGVPIIGIPIFGDQFINVNSAIAKGFAKKVDLTNNFAKDLRLAIEDMITDLRYTQKVKELSMIYHDRPTPPHKELVHWVEHVVRTRGAAHLRSPALLVPWYQKVYLDVAIVIIVIALLVNIVTKQIFKILCKDKHDSEKKLN